jgi:regulatory protein YycI of two-component signal transduction system YycFG
MYAEVGVYEGGELVKTERMNLKMLKEYSEVVIYENEDGRPVVYFKKKDEYILISNEMA